MFSTTSRHGRNLVASPVSAVPVTSLSDFHSVRMQEHQRTRILAKQGVPGSVAAATTPATDGGAVEGPPDSYFVPSLQALCADLIAKNFANMPEVDELRSRGYTELYKMVLDRVQAPSATLPPTIPAVGILTAVSGGGAAAEAEEEVPLSIRVQRISDESYWRRCCEARWSLGQLSKFAGERLQGKEYGWKRLYLERVLSDFLQSLCGDRAGGSGPAATQAALRGSAGMASLRGTHTMRGGVVSSAVSGFSVSAMTEDSVSYITYEEARALAELCAVCRDYVHTVELPCQFAHLRLHEHLFSRIPGILHFSLTYGAANTGIGFDRSMIGFTDEDAEDMRLLLTRYTALDTLRLPRNKLTPARTQVMASGLVTNTTLRVLDLSCNALDDVAASAIALLLSRRDFPLEELDLSDNDIRGDGACAIAQSFAMNRSLRVLRLNQNRIPDQDGGDVLVRGLLQQPGVTELHLANNKLGTHTAAALLEVLPQLTQLAALHLSGNGSFGGITDVHTSSIAKSVAAMEKQAAHEAAAGTTSASVLSVAPSGSPVSASGNAAVDNFTAALTRATISPPTDLTPSAVLGGALSSRHASVPASSESGPILCAAVAGNTSLQFVDVRFCNLTTEEVSAIEASVQSRVQGKRTQEVMAREEDFRSKMRAIVDEKVMRMHVSTQL